MDPRTNAFVPWQLFAASRAQTETRGGGYCIEQMLHFCCMAMST